MGLNIQTARFIDSSDFFEPFPDIARHFEGGDYDFSWGDNNRSMIDTGTMVTALEDRVNHVPAAEIEPQAIPESMSPETAAEVFLPQISTERWEEFKAYVATIPSDVYIDLEN